MIFRHHPKPLLSLWVFGVKQAWSALFGGLMLFAILITEVIELPGLHRYDWLFLFAIGVQLLMLLTKLERPREVLVIVLFHLVGLGMEVFKTSDQIGSWQYPGESFFHLGNVPLFSGFMYAAVGSYIARSWRVFHLSFSNYPNRLATIFLAVAIYINFFTHHFFYDFRYALLVIIVILYGKTRVSYKLNKATRHMPLVLGFALIALFIWIAENVGTYTGVWLYPYQLDGWHLVSLGKISAWLLLMAISFIMVDLLHYVETKASPKNSELTYKPPFE